MSSLGSSRNCFVSWLVIAATAGICLVTSLNAETQHSNRGRKVGPPGPPGPQGPPGPAGPTGGSANSPHRYYRLIIDSVKATDGYSSINELEFKINGAWQVNATAPVGQSKNGPVTLGAYTAVVTLTTNCCGRDLSLLFNNNTTEVAWVSTDTLEPTFDTNGNCDSLIDDGTYALFDFGQTPVKIQALRIYGDPWTFKGIEGAESPDRFRLQFSDDGVNFITAYFAPGDTNTVPVFETPQFN